MRILLDECIPRRLKYALSDHDCKTVPEVGFSGQKNGVLLTLAESAGFELFLTMDKGLQYQQNLAARSIAILIVRALKPSQGYIAAPGCLSNDHEFDPAWRSDTGRRLEDVTTSRSAKLSSNTQMPLQPGDKLGPY